jgi:hypothetical protein
LRGDIFKTEAIQIIELKRRSKKSRQTRQLESQDTSDLPAPEIEFGIIVVTGVFHKKTLSSPGRLVIREHSPAMRRPESHHTLVDNDPNDPR